MQLLQKHATFSRILVDISGNSIRPVRCSTNKPSGAVKIAVVTNVWAKDMAKKFKAEVKHHLLLSCWSLRTCSPRWNNDPRQTRASRTWGFQLPRTCNRRASGNELQDSWVWLQGALCEMASPKRTRVCFLFKWKLAIINAWLELPGCSDSGKLARQAHSAGWWLAKSVMTVSPLFARFCLIEKCV